MKMKQRAAFLLLTLTLASAMILGGCSTKREVLKQPTNDNTAPAYTADTAAESAELTVATYNIKACTGGDQLEAVAKVITESGADIVALQEVDSYAKRSGKIEQIAELSKRTLPYYHFFKAMDFQGGAYGLGILSRYPLENCQTTELKIEKDMEPRILASATVTVQGIPLTIRNTHLSFEDKETRLLQAKSINDMIDASANEILMGDFNPDGFDNFAAFTNLTPLVTAENPLQTYRGEDEAFTSLDNILVTSAIAESVSSETLTMLDADASDHNLLLVKITIHPVQNAA